MRIRPAGLEDVPAINEAGLRINTRVRPEGMVVAEDDDGAVLGFAYRFRSGMHPSRYWATIRVREDHRREGLGTDLLRAIGRDREQPLPFYIRVREENPALDWARHFGGTVFQVSPPMELDLRDAANRAWLEGLPEAVDGVSVVPARELTNEAILQAFLDTYDWVHRDWSPAASREYIASVYGPDLEDDLLPDIASFAVRDLGGPAQKIVAGIWAFRESAVRIDAVGEVVDPDDAQGDALAAAVLRRAALAGAEAHEVLAMDGYASDRHMYPLVASAPKVGGTALVWMEYDVPAES